MALLANGIYTIEPGSKVWRHLLNVNFNQIYSITYFDSVSALYSDTSHTHTGYKDRNDAESDITTAMSLAFGYDILYDDITNSLVFLDRVTATYKRMYADNGVLLLEDV